MTLRISIPSKEGVYQGSKWLKLQVLCEAEEMEPLFERLSPVEIFPLTGIVDGNPIDLEHFLSVYKKWVDNLKKGILPEDLELKKYLAAVCVKNREDLWLQEIPQKGYLTKISRPVLQMQAHYFTYSALDDVIRPMSMGSQSIFWGLQFAFPQVYQDSQTMDIKFVEDLSIFETLRKWSREFTKPTSFLAGQNRINSSIRIGRKTLSWIHEHPQLKMQQLAVWNAS